MSNFNIQLKYKPCTIEILSLEDSHTVINYKQGVFNAYRHLFVVRMTPIIFSLTIQIVLIMQHNVVCSLHI